MSFQVTLSVSLLFTLAEIFLNEIFRLLPWPIGSRPFLFLSMQSSISEVKLSPVSSRFLVSMMFETNSSQLWEVLGVVADEAVFSDGKLRI